MTAIPPPPHDHNYAILHHWTRPIVACRKFATAEAMIPFLAALMVFFCWPLTIGHAEPVRVGVEVAYPPFEFVNPDNGQPDGFAVDLFREVAAVSSLDPSFTLGTWSKVLAGLKRGEFDILPFVAMNEERAKSLEFTVPVVTTSGAIFTCATCDLGAPEHLEGRRIGVMRDDVADDYLRDQPWAIHIVRFDTLEAAFLSLIARRVDAVLAPHLTGLHISESLGLQNVIKVAGRLTGLIIDYAFAVRKGDHQLLARLNGGLAILHESGVYDTLYQKWFPLAPTAGIPLGTALNIAGFGVAIFALIITSMYWRQRRLARLAQAHGLLAARTAALDRSFATLTMGLLANSQLSVDQIATSILEKGKVLTGSRQGFVGYVDGLTGHLICPTACNGIWPGCNADGQSTSREHIGGLWGWILNHQEAVLSNDPDADPRAKGTSQGSDTLERLVGAPAMLEDQLVGLVVLANANRPYEEHDLTVAQRLAMIFAMAMGRRRMELALESEKHRAEAASRTKSIFLAQMSHELRTPLNAIIGFSDLLRRSEDRNGVMPPQASAYANHIRSAGTVLLGILDDLLLLSEAETARTVLVQSMVDIAALMDEVASLFRDEARGRDLALDIVFPARPIWTSADPQAVRRMLFNLIHNAMKFTPNGGGIHLSAWAERDGATTLTVKDTGVGIAEDKIRLVLEPFQQADDLFRRRTQGAGLGLSIVSKLMALHRGSLGIESRLGEGTTVTLRFPPPSEHSQDPKLQAA